MVFYAIVDYNKTRITIMNMSSFIYSFVSEPVLVCSNEGELMLLNEAAKHMFPEISKKTERAHVLLNEIFDVEDDFANGWCDSD